MTSYQSFPIPPFEAPAVEAAAPVAPVTVLVEVALPLLAEVEEVTKVAIATDTVADDSTTLTIG